MVLSDGSLRFCSSPSFDSVEFVLPKHLDPEFVLHQVVNSSGPLGNPTALPFPDASPYIQNAGQAPQAIGAW